MGNVDVGYCTVTVQVTSPWTSRVLTTNRGRVTNQRGTNPYSKVIPSKVFVPGPSNGFFSGKLHDQYAKELKH